MSFPLVATIAITRSGMQFILLLRIFLQFLREMPARAFDPVPDHETGR
jgi:hypothetical protein